ncbi:MAG: ribonuclease H-like domain-containing protein [Deltaproteobacteria bacterium]|nr:ribonuclease H-like domain-containing protein [Deltaproteobacteria bacterium]MCB9785852.1 ribonuclease H-like domain-containing protein [Deltaproteobacteria bacterium]
MKLGDRLRRTLGEATPEGTAPGSPLRDELERYGKLRERAAAAARGELGEAVSLAAVSDGGLIETPRGPAWVVDTRFELTHLHGTRRIGTFFDTELEHLPALVADERLHGRDARQALFLDIEATGLDHGAGTHAFLIGWGRLDGQELLVRQALLREPAEEEAVLQLLVDELERDPLLVSFNGKSYDLTVLQSRLVIQRFYHRTDCDLKLRPHLDLLHLGRNLHRGRFPDTRLGTLERQLLGFERIDDVPGHLVPSCWFHFLRSGDAGPLGGVLLHNLHDVVSMVTLAERLAHEALPLADPTRDAAVSANLARLLLRRGMPGPAREVLAPHTPHGLEPDGLRSLVTAARRSGDAAGYRAALETLVRAAPEDAAALGSLARLLARDADTLGRAVELAERAWKAHPSRVAARRLAMMRRRLAAASPPSPAEPEELTR